MPEVSGFDAGDGELFGEDADGGFDAAADFHHQGEFLLGAGIRQGGAKTTTSQRLAS